jgi:hypothetical protein
MRRCRSIAGDAQQLERQGDVLLDREIRQHVERLEHEADRAAPQQRPSHRHRARKIGALEHHASGVRPSRPASRFKQRRLADAGLAHDREVFARSQLEVEPSSSAARPSP